MREQDAWGTLLFAALIAAMKKKNSTAFRQMVVSFLIEQLVFGSEKYELQCNPGAALPTLRPSLFCNGGRGARSRSTLIASA